MDKYINLNFFFKKINSLGTLMINTADRYVYLFYNINILLVSQ
jgi:hypothetical protein